MAVLLPREARAAQMVAAGLDRGESLSTIASRLTDVGAIDTEEELQLAIARGQLAFNAGLQLSLGNAAGAEQLLGQIASGGADSLIVTANVEIIPPGGQAGGSVNPATGERERNPYRTVQFRISSLSDVESVAREIARQAENVSQGSDTPGFNGPGVTGAVTVYSVLGV